MANSENKLSEFVRTFGSHILRTDWKVLVCQVCHCKINHNKTFNIFQHLKTKKHTDA